MTRQRRLLIITFGSFAFASWLYAAWWMLEHKATARRALVLTFGMLTLDGFGPTPGAPTFIGLDATRKQLPIGFVKIAEGFHQPTDIQFMPGNRHVMFVLEKAGRCSWIDLDASTRGVLFDLVVNEDGEMGLLGLAFHPRFIDNHKLYVHSNARVNGNAVSRISEWQMDLTDKGEITGANERRVLLEVKQPFDNHKGGQLAFGPDGFLYIGFGDGGDQRDPQRNGQNLATLLGKLLRIDVDHKDDKRAYAIPDDNPFVSDAHARPEIWAYGLRNPWRFAFDPKGRLIVADVGQEKWEEISIVSRGDNLGWNLREGPDCFLPESEAHCDVPTKAPLYAYGRDDGSAVAGGFVYTADDFPALRNKYVFADVTRGRIWAITLPNADNSSIAPQDVIALGGYAIVPTTFGQDAQGHIYVAQFGMTKSSGVVYRLAPP